MTITSKLKTYWNTDFTFKWLTFKVLFLLGLGRAVVLVIPFKRIASWMGKTNSETKKEPIELKPFKLDQLAKVIRAVSPLTPWKSNCFAQALCAHWLLSSKSIEHTIYFGVKFEESEKFKAHAWLRVGNRILTGGSGHSEYSEVGSFACIFDESYQ